MASIQPIDIESQRRVVDATSRCIGRASDILDAELPQIDVRFDLRGTAAGMFCHQGRQSWIRYNPWIFAQNLPLHIEDTVAHEVAHYGVHKVFGRLRPKPKPHGVEWQSLVQLLGGKPSARFELDTEGLPLRRQRRFSYRCDCREHEVSATRHNRARKGTKYLCRYCHSPLSLIQS